MSSITEAIVNIPMRVSDVEEPVEGDTAVGVILQTDGGSDSIVRNGSCRLSVSPAYRPEIGDTIVVTLTLVRKP